MSKPRNLFWIWTACTAFALWIGWLVQPGQVDDASIYLRYVRNIVTGAGWIYNAGESVNGSTSAGNTILLALASFVTRGFAGNARYHAAQILVFGLSLGAAAFFTFRIFRPRGVVPATIATVLMFCTPYLYWLVGMDTSLILGFSAAVLWTYQAGRIRLSAALASGLFLVRPDGVFLIAVLGLHWLWIHRRRLPWRQLIVCLAIFAVPILAWLAFSYVHFGALLPKTLGAKLAQTKSGLHGEGLIYFHNSYENLRMFFERRVPATPGHLYFHVSLAIAMVGGIGALVRRHPAWPIIAWGLLQWLAYGILNLPNYLWYYLGINVAICMSYAVALGWLYRVRMLRPLVLLLLIGFVWPTAPKPFERKRTLYPDYYTLADWVRSTCPTGSSLACAEIGVLGFELPNYTIVDMWGLVTKGGVEAITEGDFTWWFRDVQPDYVVLHDPVWGGPELSVFQLPEFHQRYKLLRKASDRQVFGRK